MPVFFILPAAIVWLMVVGRIHRLLIFVQQRVKFKLSLFFSRGRGLAVVRLGIGFLNVIRSVHRNVLMTRNPDTEFQGARVLFSQVYSPQHSSAVY